MAEVQDALKAIQAVQEQKTAKPMVRMVPGRPGVFEQTGRFTTSTVPGRPGVDLSKYEVSPAGPLRAAARRQLTTAGEVGRAVAPSVGRIGLGALGGAGAAMTGYEAYELGKKIQQMRDEGKEPSTEDIARLASKSAATLGGAIGMLPFGVTQMGGLLLSAPEAAWSAYDWAKQRKHAVPEGGLPEVDAMGNPIGVSP